MAWTAAGAKRILESGLESGEPAQYVSLHTADPGTTGANEKTAGEDGYARVQIPDGAWNFPASSTSNVYTALITERLTFPTPTGTYGSPISHLGVWSAITGGTFQGSFPLAAIVTPQNGVGLYFLANTLGIPVPTDD